ncbi:MAG: LamG-like jellyroll fold domain-containing protein [Actinomycetota bacterium]
MRSIRAYIPGLLVAVLVMVSANAWADVPGRTISGPNEPATKGATVTFTVNWPHGSITLTCYQGPVQVLNVTQKIDTGFLLDSSAWTVGPATCHALWYYLSDGIETIEAQLDFGVDVLVDPAPALTPLADWQMNEPTGATVIVDGSGHGLSGTIGSAVVTGWVVDGATGYHWPFTLQNQPPPKPERLVQVPSDALNPGTHDYAVTVRFRTTHSGGNIIQKGQAGSPTGYFKWQDPKGRLSCLFRGLVNGSLVGTSVNSGTLLMNDGVWHTVTCTRTTNAITMVIDGTTTRTKSGATGSISNRVPLTIGGKLNCDQVSVTCDYFSGDIDFVRIDMS